MPRLNLEIAGAFRELADLTEITEADRFRVLAYRRVADALAALGRDVGEMSDAELLAVRGIGKGTLPKIREMIETGSMAHLEELRAEVPPGVRQLAELPGLGFKKAALLCRELGISTLDELRAAVEAQSVRGIKGMGAKTEENLRRALAAHRAVPKRFLLSEALRVAEEFEALLKELPAVLRVEHAGSLRRSRETIGDIDLLVASREPSAVTDAFVAMPQVQSISARGATKSSIVSYGGIQIDLRVVAPDEFGAALQYFTGSKEHNVKVREHAVKLGLKLSEYGVFRVREGARALPDPVRLASETEEEVYAALGMQTPPPELRENRGEVELALNGKIPGLVEVDDVRGDLQSHSNYSDGRTTVEEMAGGASARGYEYYAVTDHGRDLHLKSLSLEDIDRQAAEIRALNAKLDGRITVLHGVELNIGPDGGLDYPDEVLARFDVVVASVHHNMRDDAATMTRRLLKAVANPHVNVLGHPTGRRLGRREPFDFDLVAVSKLAAERGVAMEINGSPQRLDLNDDRILVAGEQGCRFAINTDAHSVREFGYVRYGVAMARRGWVSAAGVINTWPLPRLRRFLTKEEI